jgi:tetratricopeptide (TPR) repeat protein
MCSVYDVQKRFGRWDAILSEPPPPTFMPVTTATWRAARAVAYAAKHQFENAEQEHREFTLVMEKMTEDIPWGRDIARRVLETSDHFIAGEIALQKRQWTKAIEHLTKAAAVEDTLSYGEPPQWLQPVRHTLGAVYLKSGNYADAERAYREDLAKWPNNGWSLYGLSRALEEQGKSAEAANVMKQHLASWAKADAPLATSCMCIPRT